MATREELLFDLIESEADVLYFIERDGEKADKAAIIITSRLGHFPKRRTDQYTVWFGRGIQRWTFKTKKEAEAKAEEILSTARASIKVHIEDRRGKTRIKEYGD